MRSDLNTRLYQLQIRLNNNSRIQEGEEPSEDPQALLAELDEVASRLEDLIARINLTNSRTVSSDGSTLTQLIARRDVLTRKSEILRSFLDEASCKVGRGSASEIRKVADRGGCEPCRGSSRRSCMVRRAGHPNGYAPTDTHAS